MDLVSKINVYIHTLQTKVFDTLNLIPVPDNSVA